MQDITINLNKDNYICIPFNGKRSIIGKNPTTVFKEWNSTHVVEHNSKFLIQLKLANTLDYFLIELNDETENYFCVKIPEFSRRFKRIDGGLSLKMFDYQ